MKGAMGNLMKQAQKMQEDMQKAQEEVANLEVEGQAGGGMVKVVMNGRHELRKVTLDDSLMQDDKEMVEDLLAPLEFLAQLPRAAAEPFRQFHGRLALCRLGRPDALDLAEFGNPQPGDGLHASEPGSQSLGQRDGAFPARAVADDDGQQLRVAERLGAVTDETFPGPLVFRQFFDAGPTVMVGAQRFEIT